MQQTVKTPSKVKTMFRVKGKIFSRGQRITSMIERERILQ